MMILFQIYWVHYRLCDNSVEIDFEHNSSLLSESDSEDENWLKGTGVLNILIIYH